MACLDSGTRIDIDYPIKSPEVIYSVLFTALGTYYVWKRAYGKHGGNNSAHTGINSEENQTANRLTSGMGALSTLFIDENNISNLLSPGGHNNLRVISVNLNNISDLTPLMNLPLLCLLEVLSNPLDTNSIDMIIPQLEKNGVIVVY